MKFIMHLTIQNIGRRKARTILTLLGVMIGVVAVVSLLSLGMGVKRELLQGYGDDTSIRQITVQTPENNRNKKMLLTDHTIEKLAKLDKVANVYPRYEVFANIQVGQYTAYTNLVGIPSEQLSAIALTDTSSLSDHAGKPEMVIGNGMGYMFFHEGSMTSYQDGNGDLNAWIGEKAKASLGFDENGITDRLMIAGVIQGDVDEFSEQSQSIYCDIDVLRSYLKKHAVQGGVVLGQPVDKNGNAYTSWVYSSVVVEVDRMEDVEFVVKKLQDMGYQTTNMKEYRDTAMRTVRMLELLLGGIGLISFLVAAIGISNTMTTAVYDRVAEIGTLKVLGCEKRELMAMILLEAGIYGFVGGACGVVLSLLFGKLINRIAVSALLLEAGTKIAVITPGLALAAIGMAMILGTIAGYFPARWAAKLSPLTAMRRD
ncbi:MAG: ABC transporter permease [Lachnospiraceae bacterium]|nr:ABC transporter permease [Lachnospiraceae bacterium]